MFQVDSVLLIAVIMGVGKLLKELNFFPTKFIPVVNLILGIVGGVIYLNPDNIQMAVLEGIIVGLTAGGFYSSVKNVAEGIKELH